MQMENLTKYFNVLFLLFMKSSFILLIFQFFLTQKSLRTFGLTIQQRKKESDRDTYVDFCLIDLSCFDGIKIGMLKWKSITGEIE